MKNILLCLLIVGLCNYKSNAQSGPSKHRQLFNGNWQFVKDIDTLDAIHSFTNPAIKWEEVTLPHTPKIESIEKTTEQWQGTCYYRTNFVISIREKGNYIALQFDAAMHEADVYLNGEHLLKHVGGYLPFTVDISDVVKFGKENWVVVKLNNQDNAAIPPGKPIKDLDFNYYGGIYRNTWLILKNKLHISDAVKEKKEVGGGVLLHYEGVSNAAATLIIKTELKNDFAAAENAQVNIILTDAKGNVVAKSSSELQEVEGKNTAAFDQQLTIQKPMLWSPESPHLYTLNIQVLQNGKLIDEETVKTGIKTFRFEKGSFILNGNKVFIRGTNRHQEYPFIGYALSDNAQYRDAYKIKAAGFNFVRCSHYPPAPAFLEACDELGILVMNSIPGWQFFGKETFQQNSLQNIRDMIHRDRNHASIILWEASLNETAMSKEYMQQSHNIVHKELPFADVFTCGWMEDVYDVFIPARQHAKAPDYWKKYTKKPLLIAEYGDWEYYAQNAGFNQKEYQDLKEGERTSRQLRTAGEKGMLQQALNFQEAHNDNLNGTPTGDANWLMFDYKRGYAADIESSGIMDINRLPKYAFYFYQSQYRKPLAEKSDFGKPMVFIANNWNNPATKAITVFSNCDEVELLLNGKIIARQKPDNDALSNKLAHPPFTFKIDKFEPGILIAKGYARGQLVVASHQQTPAKPSQLKLDIDYSGKTIRTGRQPDIVFVYAKITDANGTLITDADNIVTFTVTGNAALIGANPVKVEGGIATILLKTSSSSGTFAITASSGSLQKGQIKVVPNSGK
jgi:beta-galactosidase